MSLSNGNRIGPFTIVGWLGAGGMGEVYRARDERLNRDVAIKLIPERFARDPHRVRRFEEEACAAGQLNHPNVLAVHDVGVHGGRPYIVCELLTGETLRARLNSGALTPRRAIEYARQTAEGLAAVHARGIIHRDLKPENLFVTIDDRIKILDFGLAKLSHANESRIHRAAETEAGTVLGTVHYMSPEQVRGEPLDVRTDIFSLGVILHEMLTSRTPFARATAADTMAAILKDDPAATLPTGLAAPIERIINRCVAKAREARFQSSRDLAFGLELLSKADLSSSSRRFPGSWLRGRLVPWAIAATVAGAMVATLLQWAPWRSVASSTPLRLSVDLGADASLAPFNVQFGNAITISPDGSVLAFVAQRRPDVAPQLYIRRLDASHATALPGTDGANAPFFSPDAGWIGFDTGLDLKKVAITGGAPIDVAPHASFRGAAWAADGTIVFSPGQTPGVRLMRVPSSGGTPVPVTMLGQGETIHAWPHLLPHSKAVLYTSSGVTGAFNDANLVVQPLPSGTPKVIQRGGYHAQYVGSGHILYVHDGTLYALPFDPERLERIGPSVRVLDGLATNVITGGAQFSVSDNGTLVYLAGPTIGAGAPLDLVDRQGRGTVLRATLANWFTPAFSPDGRRLALATRAGPSEAGDIWVDEGGREPLVRITSDAALDAKPVWTPDGRRITFASDRGSADLTPNLFWAHADASGSAERLTTSKNEQLPGSWHPSGRFLAFEESNPETMRDVMILPMEGNEIVGWKPGTPTLFVGGPQMDWEPRFSPDGRWLAYASGNSGRRDVYVRPFPGPGPAVQVSPAGGELPTWSPTRREIIYDRDGELMVTSYAVDGARFKVGVTRPWPGSRHETRGRNRMFDVHPDGERVVLARAKTPSDGGANRAAQFVFNFFEELQRLAPTRAR